MTTLVEKFQSTEAGRHARAIGDILYDASALTQKQQGQLRAVHDYLESLAWQEIESEIPEWMREWAQKQKLKAETKGSE